MGWASGADLMRQITVAARKHISDDETRVAFYEDAIRAFEDHDADTLGEVNEFNDDPDPAFDLALQSVYDD